MGGGIFLLGNSEILLKDNEIIENISKTKGGGIYVGET